MRALWEADGHPRLLHAQHHPGLTQGPPDPGSSGLLDLLQPGPLCPASLRLLPASPRNSVPTKSSESELLLGPLPGVSLPGDSGSRVREGTCPQECGARPAQAWRPGPPPLVRPVPAEPGGCPHPGASATLPAPSSSWPPARGAAASPAASQPSPGPCAPSPQLLPVPSTSASLVPGHASC